MPILHKAKYILLNGQILENGALLINNGKIEKVLKSEEIGNDEGNAQIIDHGRALLTPGFINLHTHLQYTDLKPFKINDQVNFTDWIIDLIKQYYFWSKEKKIQSLKNGIKETVKSGVTCVVNLAREEEFLEVFNDEQIKSFVFLETFSNSDEMSEKEYKRLAHLLENKFDNVRVGISPHSIYNVHASLWKKLAQFSADNDILVHTHLAESQDETNWLNGLPSGIDKLHKFARWNTLKPERSGLNPVEYLEYLGVLDILKENLITAHLNQLDTESVENLISYGIKIAHCPRSNMLLHNRTLDLDKLSDQALQNTGLGTDSKFSNYDLNILKEAKFIKDRTSLNFFEIMNLLTINPAKILKINDNTGSLESGKDADFLVFNLEENRNYEQILDREGPNDIYVRGKEVLV